MVLRTLRRSRGDWRVEDSPFDLRSSDTGASDAELTKSFVVGDDVAASLRDLQLLDRECERLVYRMVGSADGAVLTIDAEDLDELLGFVAAEANHEEDRRRRKRLDGAFLVLQGALDPSPVTGPCWPWVRRARLRASGGLSRWSFGTELHWTWSNQPSSTSLPTGQASCGSSRLEDGLTVGSMRAGGSTSPGMVSTRATRSTTRLGNSRRERLIDRQDLLPSWGRLKLSCHTPARGAPELTQVLPAPHGHGFAPQRGR